MIKSRTFLMVSKPDDIPADAWVAALNIDLSSPVNDDFINIARAIMAEREACATLAEDDTFWRDADAVGPEEALYFMGYRWIVSAAIRNRSGSQ